MDYPCEVNRQEKESEKWTTVVEVLREIVSR